MTYIEVWCYPYPPDYQPVTQNGFTLAAQPCFFMIYPKRFTFSLYIPLSIHVFPRRLTNHICDHHGHKLGHVDHVYIHSRYDTLWIIVM